MLGLPAALAELGWAGGIIVLVFTFWVSWYTYKLLVKMHEIPDPTIKAAGGHGIRRLDRYQDLTCFVFGKCGHEGMHCKEMHDDSSDAGEENMRNSPVQGWLASSPHLSSLQVVKKRCICCSWVSVVPTKSPRWYTF